MAIVIINGKKYDAQTGLQIDQPIKSSLKSSPKKKRISKQERLAAEIAREFAEFEQSEVIKSDVKNNLAEKTSAPSWISDYVSSVSNSTPNWISNYILGNDPIEIEPIDLPQKTLIEENQRRSELSRQKPNHLNRTPGRATTLNRNFTKNPCSLPRKNVIVARREARKLNIEKHPSIQRFAHAPTNAAINSAPKITDKEFAAPFIPNVANNKASALKPTHSQIKNVLNNELSDKPLSQKLQRRREKIKVKRFFRAPTLVTMALAFVILGGYFAYINIPTISIRVAANQAGINARIPYMPNGYSIDGPVAHMSGQIRINYRSNSGTDGYSITQQKSLWGNADIVRYLLPQHEEYRTLDVNGMIVYRFGNDAVWIKDNILFTLNGNDLMSDEKIKRIAESVQS